MATPLSRTFKSLKPHSKSVLPITKTASSSIIPPNNLPQVKLSKKPSSSASTSSPENPWTVYLILSTNPPIKTYVGVTNNLSRRLKQHNGELTGGAKASSAGRPWICACLIQGFLDKSKVIWASTGSWILHDPVMWEHNRRPIHNEFLLPPPPPGLLQGQQHDAQETHSGWSSIGGLTI